MPTNTQIQQFVEQYYPIAQQMEQKYGIPAYALMTQMAHESNFGTSNMAQGKNNFGGLGANDSNPSNALTFESPQEAMDYQARIQMAKAQRPENQWLNKRYAPTAAVIGDKNSKPDQVFAAMQDSKYASDPNYANNLMTRYNQIKSYIPGTQSTPAPTAQPKIRLAMIQPPQPTQSPPGTPNYGSSQGGSNYVAPEQRQGMKFTDPTGRVSYMDPQNPNPVAQPSPSPIQQGLNTVGSWVHNLLR